MGGVDRPLGGRCYETLVPKQDRGQTIAKDKISETWSFPRCDKQGVCVGGWGAQNWISSSLAESQI